ncbi:MAG: hypothetical protein ACRDBY_06300 [Cetobacterium sp.]
MNLLIIEDDSQECKSYTDEIQGYNEEYGKNITFLIKKTKEEGLKAVNEEDFDAAIVDLNLGIGCEGGGNEIIKKIFKEKRVPIYIVSGTPNEYEEIDELSEKNLLLKKITRGDITIEEILNDLLKLYNTGLTKILNRNGKLDQLMDEIFLKYSEELVKNLQENDQIEMTEKENIISRFCASIISEKLKHLTPKYHPCEIYYTPPLKNEITTGDILVDKSTGKKRIILTPACDLEKRSNGSRKVDTVLIAGIESEDEIHTHNNPTNKTKAALIKELKSKKYREYYEYLPIDNEMGQAINFSDLLCVKIDDLIENYNRESSLSETFLKEIIFNFSRYYGRQGIPELH